MKRSVRLFFVLIFLSIEARAEIIRDIEYAVVDGKSLGLDLYKPANPRGPLIVWVHGGAWRSGSKSGMPLTDLVAEGYTIASVDYRLSTVARFPAQAHDIKAAIRFLRESKERLGIDTSRIVVAGDSAGGHLAALVGVSNGDKRLEGEVGEFPNRRSEVHGIISFYGGSDLTTILDQSTPHGLSVRKPALDLLLGGQPDKEPELAKLASPVLHVDKSDPPLLLFHGDRDPQMPINQAHQLVGAYEAVGAKVRLKVVHGAAHGGKAFYDSSSLALVKSWLKELEAK